MILNLVYPSDRPLANEAPPIAGVYHDVGDPVDAADISASPFVVFSGNNFSADSPTCLIEESDDLSSWTTMAGVSFIPISFPDGIVQVSSAVRTKRYVRATLDYEILDSGDRWGFNVLLGDIDPEAFGSPEPPEYLGRFQQGQEIALVLQCTDAAGSQEDPASTPHVQIFRDPDAELIETIDMPADLRDVESGLFRKPLFLGPLYSEVGRHAAVFKWLDSDGVAHAKTAHFHVLPGGSSDGNVIALFYSTRPDANYLLMQGDSGRLIRKANPR